ncbi:MAG TPA: class I SAM-dependent methyltransferase [Thermohalobaculum sp.]|nr:class I SAM-dependent methyltransferase [Thermohalobaculum sp.]
MSARTRLRRLRMGAETLFGLRAQGFFLPYRYADRLEQPGSYPALEALMQAAEPAMEGVLEAMEERRAQLAAFAGPAPRPRWEQQWFPRLDGAAAYTLAAQAGRRIVEVGSGHSTRFLAAGLKAGGGGSLTCIDPAPRAAIRGAADRWHERVLGPDDARLFQALGPGDVAFFDSSHLVMPGTDVDIVLNRLLPVLAPGVLVHLHDILLPDPYPADWAWRGYNEQNALAGWLLGGAFDVVFSSHYAVTRMGAASRPCIAALPLPEGARETSLWLRRRPAG